MLGNSPTYQRKLVSSFAEFSILLVFFIFAQAVTSLAKDNDFSQWLDELRVDAEAQGISPQTLDQALVNVELLDKVVELDRKQPEHKLTLDEYLAKTISDYRIERGRELLAENKELLAKVSEKYRVPAPVIVALWGMETGYGENTGKFNTINALVTLAYEGLRGEFFRTELFNALWIMEVEELASSDFRGSWAGAFGQCQFMPTSFIRYAVDFDGDGKRDIWGNKADIFASIANYLHSEGWKEEGKIEEGSHNFKVLKKWNRSTYFATAIGELSQSVAEENTKNTRQ